MAGTSPAMTDAVDFDFGKSGAGADPALGSESLLRFEAVLVAHLARALDPVADIDERLALAPRIFDVVEDHIGAEAALLLVRIVEAVDHRNAVAQAVAQRHGEQRRGAVTVRIGAQAILGDEGLDHR